MSRNKHEYLPGDVILGTGFVYVRECEARRYCDKNGKLFTKRRCIIACHVCGKTKEMFLCSAYLGKTKSCGCGKPVAQWRPETMDACGLTTSEHYNRWYRMMDRCYNPKCQYYYRYGGRGISVDLKWHSFKNYLEDIQALDNRREGDTIDRINNNGNYEPSNVRWADAKTQAENREVSKK